MNITLSEANNVLTIMPDGEINLDNSHELESILNEKLDQGASSIVINLKAVSYIDSSTIGMLIATWIKANSKGVSLRISSINDNIREIFSLSKIDKFLPIDQ